MWGNLSKFYMEYSDLCTITGFFFGIWLHLCASLIPIPRAAAGCKYRQNQYYLVTNHYCAIAEKIGSLFQYFVHICMMILYRTAKFKYRQYSYRGDVIWDQPQKCMYNMVWLFLLARIIIIVILLASVSISAWDPPLQTVSWVSSCPEEGQMFAVQSRSLFFPPWPGVGTDFAKVGPFCRSETSQGSD